MALWKTDEGRCSTAHRSYNPKALDFKPHVTFLERALCLGKKLRELLMTHGSFSTVETHLKRWRLKMKRLRKLGGWYTKIYLENEAKWTKPGAQLLVIP